MGGEQVHPSVPPPPLEPPSGPSQSEVLVIRWAHCVRYGDSSPTANPAPGECSREHSLVPRPGWFQPPPRDGPSLGRSRTAALPTCFRPDASSYVHGPFTLQLSVVVLQVDCSVAAARLILRPPASRRHQQPSTPTMQKKIMKCNDANMDGNSGTN